MPKPKKESHSITLRMDKQTYDRLSVYCEDSGQSKTIAIERAINMYIDEYEKKMQLLKEKHEK